MSSLIVPRRTRQGGLSLLDVPSFLAGKGLIQSDFIHGTGVEFRDESSRNRVFKAVLGENHGLLVKQAGPEAALRAVMEEGQLLQAIQALEAFKPLREFVPVCRLCDSTSNVVVVELLHPCTSLEKLHLNAGTPSFPVDFAQRCGQMLAALHQPVDGLPSLAEFLKPRKTIIHNLVRSANYGMGPNLERMSKGVRLVFQHIDTVPWFHPLSQQATQEWSMDRLVHGDIRWSNFLVGVGTSSDGGPVVKLIDWEFARPGDAVWDVTTYIAEYARFWARATVERFGGSVAGHRVNGSDPAIAQPFDLSAARASAAAFWESYVAARALSPTEIQQLKTKCMLYMPFALLRIAAEFVTTQESMGIGPKLVVDAITTFNDPAKRSELAAFVREPLE